MAKKKVKSREHRALGGSILRVKGRAGIYGQLRGPDGRRMQKLLLTGEQEAAADKAAKESDDPNVKNAAQLAETLLGEWALKFANESPVGEGLRVVTASEFLPEFLKTIKGHVGAAHYADVEARCTRFADFAGERPMAEIGADVVQDYFAKLAEKPGRGHVVPVRKKDGTIKLDKDGKPEEVVVRGKLTPGAMRHARNALSSMWACAISRRVATANIWAGAKIARGQQFVPVNLTDEEVERILTHVVAPVRPILAFAAETGLRLGEARALTWLHVARDYSRFTVAVAKSGRARTLPTTARAREVLKERWGKHVAKTHGPDLVFDDYSRSYIHACFKDAVKAAGVDWGARVHDLRHHVGSALASANAPVDVIMSALGHAQISTVQRYLHHGADALTDAFRAVEAARPPAPEAVAQSA